jgi:sporulation protein YlmC with PRC-barrel domain
MNSPFGGLATVPALCAAALAAAVVSAQAPDPPASGADVRIERVSALIGGEIRNKTGEHVGEVRDLVFDKDGRISYAVLSFGGMIGHGEKYFAAPWESIVPGPGNTFVMDVDSKRLKDSPSVDKKDWPASANGVWAAEADRYYARRKSPDRGFGGMADRLRAASVFDAAGRKVAHVEDVMVDMGAGRATMLVLRPAAPGDAPDRLVVVPWHAASVGDASAAFTLLSGGETLAQAPGFDRGAWPKFDRAFLDSAHRRFGPDADRQSAHAPSGVKASDVLGRDVRNRSQEILGRIDDLVLDVDGRLAYAVLSFGGLFGLGGSFVAAPWESLVRAPDGAWSLDIGRDRLRAAPGFDPRKSPTAGSAVRSAETDRYFGVRPERDPPYGGRVRASRSAPLRDAAGAAIGEVEEIVLELDRGRASLLLVRRTGAGAAQDALVALPWGAATLDPRNGTFALNAKAEDFADSPSFPKNAWPAFDRAFSTEVRRRFGRDDADVPAPVAAPSVPVVRAGVRRSTEAVGTACRGVGGERLGAVRDLVFSSDTGRVAFVVLDLRDDGGRLRAVPWELCSFQGRDACVVSCDAAKLRGGPSFAPTDWPDFDDEGRRTELHEHFGVKRDPPAGGGR